MLCRGWGKTKAWPPIVHAFSARDRDMSNTFGTCTCLVHFLLFLLSSHRPLPSLCLLPVVCVPLLPVHFLACALFYCSLPALVSSRGCLPLPLVVLTCSAVSRVPRRLGQHGLLRQPQRQLGASRHPFPHFTLCLACCLLPLPFYCCWLLLLTPADGQVPGLASVRRGHQAQPGPRR